MMKQTEVSSRMVFGSTRIVVGKSGQIEVWNDKQLFLASNPHPSSGQNFVDDHARWPESQIVEARKTAYAKFE